MSGMGFQYPSPLDRANSAEYGEPGWHIRILPRPCPKFPDRAIVSTPCARLMLNDRAEAEHFAAADLGDLSKILAPYYLANLGT